MNVTNVTDGQTRHDDIGRAYASHRAAKARMVGLPDGEKTLRICVTVCPFRHDTGVWQTDRRTSCHGIVRAMHTRRAVKIKSCIGQTAYTASKTVSVHPMHRYSPDDGTSRMLNLKHPDVRLFTFFLTSLRIQLNNSSTKRRISDRTLL